MVLHLGHNPATMRPLGLCMARPLPYIPGGRVQRPQQLDGTRSVSGQQPYPLRHRQRKNAEPQVAQHLGVTAHTYLTTAKVVLETTLDALHG